MIELLLRYGASIEATTESGLTPLHVAAFMGHTQIVTYLLENGANTESPTIRGETALHLAARANQTEIMRLLLRSGAKVDAKAKVNNVKYRNLYFKILLYNFNKFNFYILICK